MTRWGSGYLPRARHPKVSVIVAVYNPGQHINELLGSLKRQTLGRDDLEVVFVDDGSTDGTGRRLKALARRHRNWVVKRIDNSGWPGRPRNVGLRLARGEYVLFADNDDVIPPEGLELMYRYARQHDSDVVIGRELGRGRVVSKEVFRRSIPDATLGQDPVLGILTPHKLYRRSLLQDNGIEFPEGVFRLEDHLFNIRCFFAAKRLSIYADRPCYVWTKRKDPEGSKNASYNEWSPFDYYGKSMDTILGVVEANTEPGDLRDRLYAHWYDTKMLMRLTDKRFIEYTDERRRQMYDAIRALATSRFGAGVDAHLAVRVRTRSALVRADRFEQLLPFATAERGVTATIETSQVQSTPDAITVAITMALCYADGRPVEFTRTEGGRVLWVTPLALPEDVVDDTARDATRDIANAKFDLLVKNRAAPEDYFSPVDGTVALEPTDTPGRFRLVARGTGRIDLRTAFAGRPATGVLDVSVRLWVGGWSAIRRMPAPEGAAPGSGLGLDSSSGPVRVYSTEKGNLSLEVSTA